MAGKFSTATLEQVRAASNIVEVIGAVLPLKRAGANFVALCPFHREKTPSFNVNPQRQIFHCFGCHKGGDVFTFIAEYENVGFGDAARRLAERARIPIEFEGGGDDSGGRALKEKLLQIHEQITQRWQSALTNEASGEPARAYVQKRGLSAEAVKLFRLGFAPAVWDDTVNWGKSKGYDLPLLEQAGLILHKEGESRYYDRFRGRLMFPICDEQGRVVAFSGRVIEGDEKTAKYVNSPETAIFTKSRVLFGLDKSKRALLEAKTAIVTEGQLDMIATYLGGILNVVAPQGTAFTADHARILKRYVEEVVLCFDSDTAGQGAAVRSFEALLTAGLAIRVAVLPAPHDPDSFLKTFGADALRQLIQAAPTFFDFYLERLCQLNDPATDRGQAAILQGMSEVVNRTGNQVLIDTYAQKTALRLAVAADAVRNEFKRRARTSSGPRPKEGDEPAAQEEPRQRPSKQEFWVLKLALLNPELSDWIAARIDLDWLTSAAVRNLISRLFTKSESGAPDAKVFVGQIEDPFERSLATEALAEDREVPNAAKQLEDLLQTLRNLALDRQIQALNNRLADPKLEDEARVALLREQQALRQLKKQPLATR